MDIKALKKRNTADLEVFKMVASTKLFAIQNNPDEGQINFWSSLFTACKNIINKRKNGSK